MYSNQDTDKMNSQPKDSNHDQGMDRVDTLWDEKSVEKVQDLLSFSTKLNGKVVPASDQVFIHKPSDVVLKTCRQLDIENEDCILDILSKPVRNVSVYILPNVLTSDIGNTQKSSYFLQPANLAKNKDSQISRSTST